MGWSTGLSIITLLALQFAGSLSQDSLVTAPTDTFATQTTTTSEIPGGGGSDTTTTTTTTTTTKTTTTTTSEIGSCVENVDFRGDDVTHISNVPTVSACDEECQNDGRCTHFTWSNSIFSTSHGCWLKHGMGIQVPLTNVISGAQGCTEFNLDKVPVLRTFKVIRPVDSAASCQALCQAESKCSAFQWKAIKRTACELKNIQMKTRKNFVSGEISSNGCTTTTISPLTDNCASHSYKILDDERRSVNYGWGARCDLSGYVSRSSDWKGPGWYRFAGSNYSQLATSPPGLGHCGASVTGWLDGVHPTVAQGEQVMKVCWQYSGGECMPEYTGIDWSNTTITVLNCSGFYIYKLPEVPSCRLRYCGA